MHTLPRFLASDSQMRKARVSSYQLASPAAGDFSHKLPLGIVRCNYLIGICFDRPVDKVGHCFMLAAPTHVALT